MSLKSATEYLKKYNLENEIMEFNVSSKYCPWLKDGITIDSFMLE